MSESSGKEFSCVGATLLPTPCRTTYIVSSGILQRFAGTSCQWKTPANFVGNQVASKCSVLSKAEILGDFEEQRTKSAAEVRYPAGRPTSGSICPCSPERFYAKCRRVVCVLEDSSSYAMYFWKDADGKAEPDVET